MQDLPTQTIWSLYVHSGIWVGAGSMTTGTRWVWVIYTCLTTPWDVSFFILHNLNAWLCTSCSMLVCTFVWVPTRLKQWKLAMIKRKGFGKNYMIWSKATCAEVQGNQECQNTSIECILQESLGLLKIMKVSHSYIFVNRILAPPFSDATFM